MHQHMYFIINAHFNCPNTSKIIKEIEPIFITTGMVDCIIFDTNNISWIEQHTPIQPSNYSFKQIKIKFEDNDSFRILHEPYSKNARN